MYSKRIFDPDHTEQDQLKDAALPNLNNSTSSAGSASEASTAATQLSLEQTTKSLEKLYVNPVTDLSPKSLNSTASTPLLSQYVPGSANPSGNSSILASVQADPLLSFNGNSANAKPFTAKTTAPQNNYNTLLGNNPSAILNNGLNPLAPSVAMGNGSPPSSFRL